MQAKLFTNKSIHESKYHRVKGTRLYGMCQGMRVAGKQEAADGPSAQHIKGQEGEGKTSEVLRGVPRGVL